MHSLFLEWSLFQYLVRIRYVLCLVPRDEDVHYLIGVAARPTD